MPGLTVFYDANVLYPAPLRDLLMRLALTDLFQAKWSARVHEEWMDALLRERPDLTQEQLDRTRRLMDAHVRDALVHHFEDLIEGLHLPDPDDRHVLAAAIRGRADVILTRNLRDFPPNALRPLWDRSLVSRRLYRVSDRPRARHGTANKDSASLNWASTEKHNGSKLAR